MAKEYKIEPISVSINEASAMIGIGRVTIYKLINEGELPSLKVGDRRLILVKEIRKFLDRKAEECA